MNIECRHLTVAFGRRVLLDRADIRFVSGQLTALTGRNGSGKSTLLRVIAGLHRDYHGEVTIGGRGLRQYSPRQLAHTLAMVATGRIVVPSLKVSDVVALGRAPHTGWLGRLSEADRRAVSAALDAVGMTAFAGRAVAQLSDGEAQRVMIARALAQDTPVILLDEPTSFLDTVGREEVVTLLRTLADRGKTVVYSTHELDLSHRLAHTTVSL